MSTTRRVPPDPYNSDSQSIMPPPRHPDFELNVRQVHEVTGKPVNEIRSDLRFTGSIETTINRVYDGTFLTGTERDPTRRAAIRGSLSSPGVADWRNDGAMSDPVGKVQGSGFSPGLGDFNRIDDSMAGPLPPAHGHPSPARPIRSTIPPSRPLFLPPPPGFGTSSPSRLLPDLDMPGMDRDLIEYFSSASQPQPQPLPRQPPQRLPPPPAGEVIDLLSSDDELPSVIIPAKRKLKEKEQAQALECLSAKKKPKSRSNEGPLDLTNVQVLDLSQPVAAPRYGLTTPKSPGKTAVPRIGVGVKDGIVASSPPRAGKNAGGAAAAGEESVYPNSSSDDSLFDRRPPVSASKTKTKTKTKVKTAATGNSAVLVISDPDSDDVDPLLETMKQKSIPTRKTSAKAALPFSAKTLEILSQFESDSNDSDSDIDVSPAAVRKKPTAKRKTPAAAARRSSTSTSRTASTAPTATAPKRRGLPEEEKARRAAEKAKKEEAAQARKEAREAAAAEKRREQELASFNKIRTSKKDSAHELIVDISAAFAKDDVGIKLVGFLGNLGCELKATWHLTGIERDWKVVKWRRKVRAEYDSALSIFVPLPRMEIRDEKYILVHLTASEFVELACPEDADALLNLDTHVGIMRKLAPGPGVRIIYMIDGLAAYARKSKLAKNNNFRAQVLTAMGGAPAPASAARRTTAPPSRVIDEESLEDALLKLQVKHSCLIQQTAGAVESAEWISILTGDISTIPYKSSSMVLDTSFCTDVGQVKTGVDAMDTWSKMLQEIHRVTPAVANGITDRYPDVKSLIRAFETQGEGALANVPLTATSSGAPSNRTVGMALSRRIWGVFAGRDEDSLDV